MSEIKQDICDLHHLYVLFIKTSTCHVQYEEGNFNRNKVTNAKHSFYV